MLWNTACLLLLVVASASTALGARLSDPYLSAAAEAFELLLPNHVSSKLDGCFLSAFVGVPARRSGATSRYSVRSHWRSDVAEAC